MHRVSLEELSPLNRQWVGEESTPSVNQTLGLIGRVIQVTGLGKEHLNIDPSNLIGKTYVILAASPRPLRVGRRSGFEERINLSLLELDSQKNKFIGNAFIQPYIHIGMGRRFRLFQFDTIAYIEQLIEKDRSFYKGD